MEEMITRQLIEAVMKDVDAGKSVPAIAAKHGIGEDLAEDLCRLYVTHPGIDADGMLNKIYG